MNIILFDGACNLCSNTISFLIKRDKKALFRFIATQSETGKILLQKYGIAQEQETTLFYIRNNRCLKRSTAILYILKDLGGFWKCFYLFIYLPARMRDAIYLFISKNRYRLFGRRDNCMMPPSD